MVLEMASTYQLRLRTYWIWSLGFAFVVADMMTQGLDSRRRPRGGTVLLAEKSSGDCYTSKAVAGSQQRR